MYQPIWNNEIRTRSSFDGLRSSVFEPSYFWKHCHAFFAVGVLTLAAENRSWP